MEEFEAAVIADRIRSDAEEAAIAYFRRQMGTVAGWYVAISVLPEQLTEAAMEVFADRLAALAALN